MKWCFQMHAHIEAESRFTAFLKASSAVLAAVMGKDPGCDSVEINCNAVDHDEEMDVSIEVVDGNIAREKMN